MADLDRVKGIVDDLQQSNACSFADAYADEKSNAGRFSLVDEARKEYESRRKEDPSLPAMDFRYSLGGRQGSPSGEVTAISGIDVNPGAFKSNTRLFDAMQNADGQRIRSLNAWKKVGDDWEFCK